MILASHLNIGTDDLSIALMVTVLLLVIACVSALGFLAGHCKGRLSLSFAIGLSVYIAMEVTVFGLTGNRILGWGVVGIAVSWVTGFGANRLTTPKYSRI